MEGHPARWWQTEPDGRILCTLCPRFCRIPEGSRGFCYIRQNRGGELISLGYGQSTGFAVDPIEKKPLAHFLPGTPVLSFGTAGCNLGCKFCQNWSISKAKIDERGSRGVSPEDVVALAKTYKCPSIAYTYNDPTIWGEFVIDVSRLARQEGIKNVFVTAGYITPEARPEVMEFIDATNVDLKAFSDSFYEKITSSHLANIKDTLKWLKRETSIWTEITTLLIPGENDSDAELQAECDWILQDLGPDVPVHFTAFHPDFKMLDKPRTPPATLDRAREIAKQAGIKYVYVGNVFNEEGQSTYCPKCHHCVIRRDWHEIRGYDLAGDRCGKCGTAIAGVFPAEKPKSFFGRRRFGV